MALSENISFENIDTSQFLSALPLIDILIVKILLTSHQYFLILTYIPPDIDAQAFEHFLDLLEVFVSDRLVVVIGDFNVPLLSSTTDSDSKSNLLSSFINSLNLRQFNKVLNSNYRTLDLVLSNFEHDLVVSRDSLPIVSEDSYHPSLNLIVPNAKPPKQVIFPSNTNPRYNFRKANFHKLYQDIATTDWSFIDSHDDVNKAVDDFYARIFSTLDDSVPKFYCDRKYSYPPWFTTSIKQNLQLKQYYHKKWKSTNNDYFKHNFQRLRKLTKIDIDLAYKAYVRNVECQLTRDPGAFWNFVRSKRGISRIPGRMNDSTCEYNEPQTIVNAFANSFSSVFSPTSSSSNVLTDMPSNNPPIVLPSVSPQDVIKSIKKLKNKPSAGDDNIPCFFVKDCAYVLAVPLCKIFNLSIKSSVFPAAWKIARISPVFKKGNNANIDNYRPVSVISAFAKVFEILLVNHISYNTAPFLSTAQHGFIERRSTTSNLATISQKISETIDRGGQLDVIYTDFSRAFDTIDHKILLQKLSSFGLSNSLIALFRSYLTDRANYVHFNGFRSPPYISTSGVPQGSNLGPMLFNIFINDLIESLECPVLAYADDIKIYHEVKNMDDVRFLQKNLNIIHQWCLENKLCLNINKCFFVSYSKKILKIPSRYDINNAVISGVSSIKDLGVTFDEKHHFTNHIHNITTAASKSLGFIFRTCKNFSNIECIISLFRAFVLSKLEYATNIWYPFYNIQINMVERLQRKFLKYLTFRCDGQYPAQGIEYGDLLERHNFAALKDRRKTLSAAFMGNILVGNIDAPDLLSRIDILVPRPESRSSELLRIPTPRTNVLWKAPLVHSARNFNEANLNF